VLLMQRAAHAHSSSVSNKAFGSVAAWRRIAVACLSKLREPWEGDNRTKVAVCGTVSRERATHGSWLCVQAKSSMDGSVSGQLTCRRSFHMTMPGTEVPPRASKVIGYVVIASFATDRKPS